MSVFVSASVCVFVCTCVCVCGFACEREGERKSEEVCLSITDKRGDDDVSLYSLCCRVR